MEESFQMLRLGVVKTSTTILMSQDSFEDHLIIKSDYQKREREMNQETKDFGKWPKIEDPTEERAEYCKDTFLLPLMSGFSCSEETAFRFFISLPWVQLDA